MYLSLTMALIYLHFSSDLIIVLRDGKMAEQGSHEQLMKIQGGVYQHLWNAQLHDNTTTDTLEVTTKTKTKD
jgi:ABC-type enterochelin transport system ATPase subunit